MSYSVWLVDEEDGDEDQQKLILSRVSPVVAVQAIGSLISAGYEPGVCIRIIKDEEPMREVTYEGLYQEMMKEALYSGWDTQALSKPGKNMKSGWWNRRNGI